MARITFGIPTRLAHPSRVTFLHAALASILAQSEQDFCIILSDDTSPIAFDYAQYENDPRIRVYRHIEPLGIFANFNFCLEQCTTEWFVPMGDDDIVYPDFVSSILVAIDEAEQENTPVKQVIFEHHNIRANNLKYHTFQPRGFVAGYQPCGAEVLNARFAGDIAPIMPAFFFSAVHAKSLLALGGYQNYGSVSDTYVLALVSLHFPAWYIARPLAAVRRHANNLSAAWNILRVLEEKRAMSQTLVQKFGEYFTPENIARIKNEPQMLARSHMELLRVFVADGRIAGIREALRLAKI